MPERGLGKLGVCTWGCLAYSLLPAEPTGVLRRFRSARLWWVGGFLRAGESNPEPSLQLVVLHSACMELGSEARPGDHQ